MNENVNERANVGTAAEGTNVENTANDFARHLIVIDMQNDFLTGALANDDAATILPRVIEKVQKARENGVQVSWTKDTHGEDYMDTQEGAKLPVPHCIKGTWGHELADGLVPFEGEVEYWKNAFGSFSMATDIKTALEQRWLNGHIMDEDYPTPKGENVEIELVGVCTDICVISNAMLLKAALPEARIVVDASCCAGVTPESHQTALDAMKACQIEVANDEREIFTKDVRFDFDFPETLDKNGEGFARGMAPCPNCHTNENLHIRSDLISLNALEHWVDCDGCGERWTDRMLGCDYAETPEQLVNSWNDKVLGLTTPEMTD